MASFLSKGVFFQLLIASDPTVENGSLYNTRYILPLHIILPNCVYWGPINDFQMLGVGLFISSIKLVGVLVVWDSKLKLP